MAAASQQGHVEIVKDLITRSPELMQLTGPNDFSCLHIACQHGRLVVARMLSNAGGIELLQMPARTGRTCLHVACEYGHADIARMLIDEGGDALLHQQADDGTSACTA